MLKSCRWAWMSMDGTLGPRAGLGIAKRQTCMQVCHRVHPVAHDAPVRNKQPVITRVWAQAVKPRTHAWRQHHRRHLAHAACDTAAIQTTAGGTGYDRDRWSAPLPLKQCKGEAADQNFNAPPAGFALTRVPFQCVTSGVSYLMGAKRPPSVPHAAADPVCREA